MERGGQPGNNNATKNKPWADALRKALVQYEDPEAKVAAGEAMAKIARTVVGLAIAGDKDAWQEIGNRLDGKPHQTLDASVTGNLAEVLAGIGRKSDDPPVEG